MIICKTHGKNRMMEKLVFQILKGAKPGKHLSNISHAIQSYVEANGFSIVREYVGRLVWKNLHGDADYFSHRVSPYNGLI